MLKNPVVKGIGMFVSGFAAMTGVQWVVSLIKGTPFEFNWIYNIGMGLIIAVLDLAIPAEKRKENRQKLKDAFKK